MEICDKIKCTGCGACENICLKNAITMKVDEYGFLFPSIDKNLCDECDLCKRVCPTNNAIEESKFEKQVYAAWNKNKKIKKKSSSGGVFSVLAEFVLKNGGVVVGVAWNNEFSTYHRLVENKEELGLLYGSKYVQSNTMDIYKKTKAELLKNRQVLFSGTPCQIHALKCFLGRDYENLVTVDLICHGVPPYKLFRKHLIEVSKDIKEIHSVNLRYKKPCWQFSSVNILSDSGNYIKPTVDDAYFNLFNFNYSLRESCHSCKYAMINRVSDITLGDFWQFIPRNYKMSNYEKGISCVMINSEKGNKLFDLVSGNLVFEKSTVQDAKGSNRSLSLPFEAPIDKEMFWKDVLEGADIYELNKKYIKKPYKIPELLWLRRKSWKYRWLLKRIFK